MPKVIFNNKKKQFFTALNLKVEKHFSDGKLSKTGNIKLFFKAAILIGMAVSLYLSLLLFSLSPIICILLCCILGVIQAGIGFNIMHDANHGSFSSRKWVNKLMGLSSNFMGVNAWIWKQRHNFLHHTYTNIDGMDSDIAKSPFLRMCPSQKKYGFHRYQYIYCVPLYALSSFLMIIGDFRKYFSDASVSFSRTPVKEHIIFWVGKIQYFFLFIALPASLFGLLPALTGFLVIQLSLGLTIASVFQLAHLVEATHFTKVNNSLAIESEWAIHQVITTADFATGNKVLSWFTGGLNFQVEHHLFPRISHVHYPAIHAFVKELCSDFSIRFNSYPTMRSAMCSHFRLMKRLGRE